MSLDEVLAPIRALPRADRLRLAQLLIVELAREEGVSLDGASAGPIWPPYAGEEAAAILHRMLAEEKATP